MQLDHLIGELLALAVAPLSENAEGISLKSGTETEIKEQEVDFSDIDASIENLRKQITELEEQIVKQEQGGIIDQPANEVLQRCQRNLKCLSSIAEERHSTIELFEFEGLEEEMEEKEQPSAKMSTQKNIGFFTTTQTFKSSSQQDKVQITEAEHERSRNGLS
ncbi:MAG: hypothetical protein REH83_02970 [Rickettsiella sp.]|nr:hypothetical protein [Rickettsiella sp.]